MNAIRPAFFLLAFVVTSLPLGAQPSTTPATTSSVTSPSPSTGTTGEAVFAELEQRVNQFFSELEGASTQMAFNNFLKGGPLAEATATESINTLRTKLDSIKGKFGRFRGSERIKADLIGSDLVLMRFLYKYESYPVVWYFTFYRKSPAGGAVRGEWMVIGIRFDTNLELLAL